MKLALQILAGVVLLSILPFLPASVQGTGGDVAASKENLDLPLAYRRQMVRVLTRRALRQARDATPAEAAPGAWSNAGPGGVS